MTTWRKELEEVFKQTGDSFEFLIITITDEELDREFDDGYGSAEGTPFTAWSDNYVYFSREYDGADFIDRVERHPKKLHIASGEI
jgi:hypothetical protein